MLKLLAIIFPVMVILLELIILKKIEFLEKVTLLKFKS